MGIFKLILGPAVDAFTAWRERKHELRVIAHEAAKEERVAKHKLKVAVTEAKIIAKQKEAQNTYDWEAQARADSGWKDEYIVIVMTAPFIGSFIPVVQDYVAVGFTYLEATPAYYQTLLFAAVGASLGIRAWDRFKRGRLE